MIDIQHDSPVPVYEQIIIQLMAPIASGDLKAGVQLADYRAFAQQLLTNPQAVARAYSDLESDGILAKHPSGGMVICAGADAICRRRLQETARQRIRQAIRQGLDSGLTSAAVHEIVERALATPPVQPLSPGELQTSIKKMPHASSHRDSQGIQDLSREKGRGSP